MTRHRQKRQRPPGATRGNVYKEVGRLRLEDAAVLLAKKRYAGAVYLAGYAIECLLKWAITERRSLRYLPANCEVHNWDFLLAESGLHPALQREPNVSAIYSELAERWGPELRYFTAQPAAPKEAKLLYGRVRELYSWLLEHIL